MAIDRKDRISEEEKIDIIMDSQIPEETKSTLLSLIRDRRVAAQIVTDYKLPDLSKCRLIVRSIVLSVQPISEEVRERIRKKGIQLAENDDIPDECYIYFVGKDQAIVDLLVNAFYRRDYELILKITTAEVPSNPRNQ